MKNTSDIQKNLEELSQAIGSDDTLMETLMRSISTERHPSQHKRPVFRWRQTMKHSMTKYATAAGILLLVWIGISSLCGPFDGTSVAFADVCKVVSQSTTIQFIMRSTKDSAALARIYEKDGHLRRTEFLSAEIPLPGDVWLVNTQTGASLVIDTKRKVAFTSGAQVKGEPISIYNMFHTFLDAPEFVVKELKRSSKAGRAGRCYQLTKEDMHYVIWADPETLLPFHVELEFQTASGEAGTQTLTDIIFDEPLDNALFNFHPEGYQLEEPNPNPIVNRMKSAVKMNRILTACKLYVQDHNSQWPMDLHSDLKAYGIQPETFVNPSRIGKVGYCYIPPIGEVTDTTVVLHEGYDEWSGGINVGYGNFHVQFVADEVAFKASCTP